VFDVVGFGESSIDYVYVVPQLNGAKAEIVSHFSACGGQVATTMVACAALGLRAAYLGPVGRDSNGIRIRSELEGRRVEVKHLRSRPADTRYAVILVDQRTGDRQVLFHRDPQLAVPAADLDDDSIPETRVLHVDAVDEPASIRLAQLGRAKGITVTSDIDTVTEHTRDLLAAVTVGIMAENVPRELTGEADMETALRRLASDLRSSGLLCVTLGARGAAALDGGAFYFVPSTPVKAVDTTGAGDVFRGALIHGLLQGWETPRILAFANTAAGISCTRPGAMASAPSLADVNRS
jgi:sulfofructose kinase